MKYEVYELTPYAGHEDKFVLEHWMDFDEKEHALTYIKEYIGNIKFTIIETY